ncbi:MAG: hypothetical protein ACX93T_03240 [Bacteroidota bacterium]
MIVAMSLKYISSYGKYPYILLLLVFCPDSDIYAQQKLNWIDLPKEDLKLVLYEYDPVLDHSNNLINAYHQIPKRNHETIGQRIEHLKNISCSLKKAIIKSENVYIKKSADVLSDIALQKANYLEAIYLLGTNKHSDILEDLLNKSLYNKEGYRLLHIRNKRKFDYKTLEMWGEFCLEAIDPCHRRLMSLFDVWRTQEPNALICDFFLWLEDQNVPSFYPSICLIDDAELPKYKITIKDGTLYNAAGELLHHTETDGERMFIIDTDFNIFSCVATNYLRHTSLSHYKPILGSGSLWVSNGTMTKLSLNSGHYIPQIEHYVQTIKILEGASLSLPNEMVLHYYENYEEVLSTIGDFKEKYFNRD